MLRQVLIDLELVQVYLKNLLDDFNDDNFILLATVINGVLQTSNPKEGNLMVAVYMLI